jgi:hypothetical protein
MNTRISYVMGYNDKLVFDLHRFKSIKLTILHMEKSILGGLPAYLVTFIFSFLIFIKQCRITVFILFAHINIK